MAATGIYCLAVGVVRLYRLIHRRSRARRYSVGISRPDRGRLGGGLKQGLILRLVLIRRALRVIIPPLTNQYLNLTKNSSLAIAIAYPEIVSVFTGTSLNQTGQEIEIIFMTMMFICPSVC